MGSFACSPGLQRRGRRSRRRRGTAAIARRSSSAVAEETEEVVAAEAPTLQLIGLGDEDDVGARLGQPCTAGGRRWPRGVATASSTAPRPSRENAGTKKKRRQVGVERKRRTWGLLLGAIRGRPAARQLPGSHAVAAGDLAACLASGEDAYALLGWASSAGPGGPGEPEVGFLFFFLFTAFVLFVLL